MKYCEISAEKRAVNLGEMVSEIEGKESSEVERLRWGKDSSKMESMRKRAAIF